MTDGVTVRVEGLSELIRTMRRAGQDLQDLKDANQRAGKIVADYASSIAPRRSGRLAGTVRSAKQAGRARVQAGRASVPYAGPIHWGWPARNIAPQPFMLDAADATRDQWLDTYLKDVQAAMDKVKGAT